MEFDPGVNYECIQCGKSCKRDWNVWVRDDLPERLGKGLHRLRVLQGQDDLLVQDGQAFRMERDESGCCCLEGNLCVIHRELGYHRKPYSCKQYPVLLVRTPDGLRVSASYTCSAVLQKAGPKLEEHREEVSRWQGRGADIDFLDFGEQEWRQIKQFEGCLEQVKSDVGWDVASRRAFFALAASSAEEPYQSLLTYQDIGLDFGSTLPLLLGALIKPCFPSRDPVEWQEFDRQFLDGLAVEIPEFYYRGPALELVRWSQSPLDSQSESELARYRESLWFRKQHLRSGGLAAGMLMLWSVGSLFRTLARLTDPQSALESIELNLLGHTRAGEQVFPILAQFLSYANRT